MRKTREEKEKARGEAEINVGDESSARAGGQSLALQHYQSSTHVPIKSSDSIMLYNIIYKSIINTCMYQFNHQND